MSQHVGSTSLLKLPRLTIRERFDDESEENRLFDQYEILGDSPIRDSNAQSPPPPHPPPPPPVQPNDDETVTVEIASTAMDVKEVWDVTRTTSTTAQEIAQSFRQRRNHAHGLAGVGVSDGFHPPCPDVPTAACGWQPANTTSARSAIFPIPTTSDPIVLLTIYLAQSSHYYYG
ncbi:hypothetical protein PIB30_062191 [Stylosanthes scabra]|uniref:Uncharacterized protein n=1 Tax=Stylosanthes scabra TaxID=79078 RepID=A0ABU6TKT3_9FABA|nr:hypothetical protein [Stylosanthes scabra]